MKRWSLLVPLALVAGLLATPAQAAPTPDEGGPAEILRYVGDASSATGNAVSNGACDVNGDDLDDVVVGAWFWDKAPVNNLGAAYVLLGGTKAAGGSLGDPTDVGAVRIDGPIVPPVPPATTSAGTFAGFAVGCIGDVNDDGLDDIAISDYDLQRAYVVFGAENFTPLGLESLGDRGFIVQAPTTAGNFSFSLAAVGDVDDDGKDDFAVAEVVADTQGRNNNGRVWVLAGRDDITDLDVGNPQPGEVLLTVDGAIAEERLGQIARAGDVNGDGVDDFVLGAYTSTPWGASVVVPGAAYVVFGGTTGAVDLLDLGTKGFKIFGPKRARDRLGISVSAAGDLDDDGRADLLIGADGVNNATTGPRNGGAAVVLGSASNDTVYTDPVAAGGQAVFTCPSGETAPTCATPSRRGYWINGVVNSDFTGYSVAGLGDVGGDGVPDLALGAYGYDPVNPATPGTTMSGAGAVYVVDGRTTGAVQQLSGLTDADGYRIDGLKAGDRMGRQVGLVGDFDGNGTRDLAAGGDFAARSGTQNGEVMVALLGRLESAVVLGGPASARPDETATFTATVTKAVGSRAPLSEGTVEFTFDGAVIDACAAVPVVNGAAGCVRAGSEEVGPGDVVATFDGGDRLTGSASTAQSFHVVKDATTTSIELSDADPRPGQLVQVRAVVEGGGAPVDAGTVRFDSDGTAITGCSAVPVSSGAAVCTTSWPNRGVREVTATFAGTRTLASSTSGATTVDVGTTSVVKPDPAGDFTYGTTPAPLTGEIRGGDDIATGTVEVREGSTVLGSSQLDQGEYLVAVPSTALTPGPHTLSIAYSGDDSTRPSERSVAVTVDQATPRVSFSRSAGTLKIGQTLRVRAYVSAVGVAPTGSVRVAVDGKVVKTAPLSKGQALTSFVLSGRKGKRSVTVTYLGDDLVASRTSPASVVTAR